MKMRRLVWCTGLLASTVKAQVAVEPVDANSLQEELDNARDLWWRANDFQETHTSNYTFEYTDASVDSAIVQVRNGQIESVQSFLNDGADIGAFLIEDLFAKIEGSIEDDTVTEITAVFNKQTGFPESITIEKESAPSEFITIRSLSHYDELQRRLDETMSTWDFETPDAYQIKTQITCFCLPEYTSEKLVTVVGGVITNATEVETGLQVEDYEDVSSVVDLFAYLQRAISDMFDVVEVTFDEKWGYPLEYNTNPRLTLADGNVETTVSYFQLLGNIETENELQIQRARWQSFDLNEYEVTYQRSCFCEETYTSPYRITVKDDAIVQVVFAEGGLPAPDEVLGSMKTVTQLFDQIQEAVDERVASIRTEYDATYGFPTSVYIDYEARIADEEFSVDLMDFSATPESPLIESERGSIVDGWQSDKDVNLAMWQDAGLTSYTYVFQRFCECSDDSEPKTIEVVDGVVASVNGEAVVAIARQSNNVPTIDHLFDKIQEAIEENAFDIRVQYNNEMGYPIDISIDYDELIADEEYSVIAQLTTSVTMSPEIPDVLESQLPTQAPLDSTNVELPTQAPLDSTSVEPSESTESSGGPFVSVVGLGLLGVALLLSVM